MDQSEKSWEFLLELATLGVNNAADDWLRESDQPKGLIEALLRKQYQRKVATLFDKDLSLKPLKDEEIDYRVPSFVMDLMRISELEKASFLIVDICQWIYKNGRIIHPLAWSEIARFLTKHPTFWPWLKLTLDENFVQYVQGVESFSSIPYINAHRSSFSENLSERKIQRKLWKVYRGGEVKQFDRDWIEKVEEMYNHSRDSNDELRLRVWMRLAQGDKQRIDSLVQDSLLLEGERAFSLLSYLPFTLIKEKLEKGQWEEIVNSEDGLQALLDNALYNWDSALSCLLLNSYAANVSFARDLEIEDLWYLAYHFSEENFEAFFVRTLNAVFKNRDLGLFERLYKFFLSSWQRLPSEFILGIHQAYQSMNDQQQVQLRQMGFKEDEFFKKWASSMRSGDLEQAEIWLEDLVYRDQIHPYIGVEVLSVLRKRVQFYKQLKRY